MTSRLETEKPITFLTVYWWVEYTGSTAPSLKADTFYLGTRNKTLPLVIHGYLPFLFMHQQVAGIQGTYEEMQVDTQTAYRAS